MRFAALLFPLWLASPASANEVVPDLTRAQVQVTGQHQETRGPALQQAFRDVLVKVSGNPALLTDPNVNPLFDPTAVSGFSYRDLMADIPKHDEQGTRARPFILTVDFDRVRLETALAALGGKPWTAERPRVLMLIGVEIGTSAFVIADAGEPGEVQRRALLAAAQRYGLPVLLPSRAEIAERHLDVGRLKPADPEGSAGPWNADVVFTGSMTFSEKDLGWIAEWNLPASGSPHRWKVRGVNFDQAFRNAVLGTAQLLSGNGVPD